MVYNLGPTVLIIDVVPLGDQPLLLFTLLTVATLKKDSGIKIQIF